MSFLKIIKGAHDHSPHGSGARFIDIFREFNHIDAIENEHSRSTVYKYQNFTDNFEAYLTATDQVDLTVTAYSMPTLKYFVLWLPENLASCDRTHIAKHVARVNKAADYAVSLGLIPFNPSGSYKVKRSKNKAVVNLEDNEFSKWVDAKWESKIYQDAQDCYNMQMGAGLSYMDLYSYETTVDASGLWLQGIRGKTKKPYFVPLFHPDFELARRMHEKHGGKFPRIENHFYNRLIREMAAILGIDKYLKTHIGRKTFATRLTDIGYSVPPIAGMLGNTDKVCETHYIRISKKKILTELQRRGA